MAITFGVVALVKKWMRLSDALDDYKSQARPRPNTQYVDIFQGSLLYQLFEHQLRAGDRATKALEKIADGLEGVEDALPLRKEAKEPSDG